MKNISIVCLVLFLFAPFFSGCMSTGGIIYHKAKYPYAVGTGDLDIEHLKTGKAGATNILGLFEIGNAGILEAARNGNIKKISIVDCEICSVLQLVSTYKTIVRGE
jgi:hypothetical protein